MPAHQTTRTRTWFHSTVSYPNPRIQILIPFHFSFFTKQGLYVYDDSQLVINQLLKEFKVKKDDLITHLTATLALGAEEGIPILVCGQWVTAPPVDGGVEEVKTVSIYEIDEED